VPAVARRHDLPGSSEPERAGDLDRYGHVRGPGPVDTVYEEDDRAFECDGGDGIAVGSVARFSKPVTPSDVEEFAHGVLTPGLVSAALARMPDVVIHLRQDCAYRGPVDLGERLMATCKVVDDILEQ
jgi:acyl dehydratase